MLQRYNLMIQLKPSRNACLEFSKSLVNLKYHYQFPFINFLGRFFFLDNITRPQVEFLGETGFGLK